MKWKARQVIPRPRPGPAFTWSELREKKMSQRLLSDFISVVQIHRRNRDDGVSTSSCFFFFFLLWGFSENSRERQKARESFKSLVRLSVITGWTGSAPLQGTRSVPGLTGELLTKPEQKLKSVSISCLHTFFFFFRLLLYTTSPITQGYLLMSFN